MQKSFTEMSVGKHAAGFVRVLEILEFCSGIFLDWKVLETSDLFGRSWKGLETSDLFGRSWKVLKICKFKGKFGSTKKERSQNKLNRVEEILAKLEKDVSKNNCIWSLENLQES